MRHLQCGKEVELGLRLAQRILVRLVRTRVQLVDVQQVEDADDAAGVPDPYTALHLSGLRLSLRLRLRLRLRLIVFVFVFLLPLPIFFHHLADVVPGVAWHEQVFPRTNVLHQATICRAVRGTAASVRQRIGQWQCLEWWVVVERVDCGQWGC